jgi:hypothetical protein
MYGHYLKGTRYGGEGTKKTQYLGVQARRIQACGIGGARLRRGGSKAEDRFPSARNAVRSRRDFVLETEAAVMRAQ